MATQPRTGLTYEDLARFPEDNIRREIIDGELIETAAPATRHQRAVMTLSGELYAHCKRFGGTVLPAPTDVYFSDTNVVEPDVLYIRPENAERIERKFIRSAPDLVVEVSSPSTRRLELHRKKELYARFGVPEYWYVDLDAERVEVYRLVEGRYGPPRLVVGDDELAPPSLPEFSFLVRDVLGPWD